MPCTTLREMPQAEPARRRAALRGRGMALSWHAMCSCGAAGRNPTEIAADLCCSRSSVYRIVRAYRVGPLGLPVDQEGQRVMPVRTTVLRPWLQRARGALRKEPTCLWLVPHPLAWRHARGHAPRRRQPGGSGRDGAPFAPRHGLGVETGEAGGQR